MPKIHSERQRQESLFQIVTTGDCTEDAFKVIEKDFCPPNNSDLHIQGKPSTSVYSSSSVVKISLNNCEKDLREIAGTRARNLVSDRATSSIVNNTVRIYNIPEIVDKSKFCREVGPIFEEIQADFVLWWILL